MTVFNVFAAFVVALRAEVVTELLPVATTRTTCNAFAYERKLVAVKKSSAVFALGFWNVLTRAVSWETKTLLSTGPHRKCPAIAPIDVDTAGTTVVRSISLTLTPGETWNAISYSLD